jgi:hypothetical protein
MRILSLWALRRNYKHRLETLSLICRCQRAFEVGLRQRWHNFIMVFFPNFPPALMDVRWRVFGRAAGVRSWRYWRSFWERDLLGQRSKEGREHGMRRPGFESHASTGCWCFWGYSRASGAETWICWIRFLVFGEEVEVLKRSRGTVMEWRIIYVSASFPTM